jgi:hypothetical protein
MLARLSAKRLPALGLKTRDDDDFSIALLDSWAAVCDILTFYQERIANESYLRTATERRSVLELAKTIGYELSPGVAASAYLAFEVDDAPGSPLQITIDKGLKVQSTPGPGELPQTFETIESIDARAEWNAMRPKLTELKMPEEDKIYIKGINTNLRKGDMLLIVWKDKFWDLHKVSSIVSDSQADRTLFILDSQIRKDKGKVHKESLSCDLEVHALRLQTAPFGYNAQDWDTLPSSLKYGEIVYIENNKKQFMQGHFSDPDYWPDRKKTSLAGKDKINLDLVYKEIIPGSWMVLVDDDGSMYELHKIRQVHEEFKSDFLLSAKTTSIYISDNVGGNFLPSRTIIYAQSEKLALAEQPLTEAIKGDNISLDKSECGLKRNQKIIVSGKRIRARIVEFPDQKPAELKSVGNASNIRVLKRGDELIVMEMPFDVLHSFLQRWHLMDKNNFDGFLEAFWEGNVPKTMVGPIKEKYENPQIELVSASEDDEVISEFALIKDIESDGIMIRLDRTLKNIYDRTTVTISANVADVTHGETVSEVLGSGKCSEPHQRFVLSQSPLTYISSQAPSGSESTLQIRVNDLLWQEVPTLYGRGPQDHVYITRTDDDGKTTVLFGDSKMGARLPSGQHNVGAVYRKGIGLGGLVKAGQIDMLMARPLGLKGAVNPLPSYGAQDRQSLAEARRNASLAVLTLDRVVSLQDYEDFARAFAGVAKSLATWTWDGEKRGVLVTVAGPKGHVIKKDEVIYKNLLKSMRKFGDPYVPLMVNSYRPALFRINASVKVNKEYQPEERVFAAVEQKLRDHFSFDARNFGQAVALSEVIAVMQNVPGVMAASIKALYRTDGSGQPGTILQAAMPRSGDKTIDEAELLTLDPAPIDLKVMP